MKIEAKIKLSNVDQWSVDWTDEKDRFNELHKLEYDIKMALFERCGIELSKIDVELNLIREK